MTTCETCNDKPIWGCRIFGCNPVESCFVLCPSCGRKGFDAPPADWVADEQLAELLLARLGR